MARRRGARSEERDSAILGPVAVAAGPGVVEAEVPPALGEEAGQRARALHVGGGISGERDDGIVLGVDEQRRDADPPEEREAVGASIIVLGAREPRELRRELLVEAEHR